jgi:hypothetical protein
MPPANAPVPAFVAEGDPIPAVKGVFDDVLIGPARKLGLITGLTKELADHGTNAETTLSERLADLPTAEKLGLLVDALASSHDTLSSCRNLIEITKITAKSGLQPHDRCHVFEMMREAAHGLGAEWN